MNDNTALDVLRQHAIVPITFQNRPIILAPAYKKHNILSSTSRFHLIRAFNISSRK